MTEQNAMAMELLDTNDTPTISGRELHRKLEIETPYHKWFPRMCAYGFTENQDFFHGGQNCPPCRRSSDAPDTA